MKIIISKSKEYKNFTDLFYRNKNAKNFKSVLSKAYNNVVYQSGYLNMPDDYIENMADIFEANSDIIDSALLQRYPDSDRPSTFREQCVKILLDNYIVVEDIAYRFIENSPEVLFGLGYFEPDTKLARTGTKDPNEIDPIQIISPAPLFLSYKNSKPSSPEISYIEEKQIFINSHLTGVINRGTSVSDSDKASSLYYTLAREADSNTKSSSFIWAKTTKLDVLDVSGLPFQADKNIDQIHIYKVDELRSASLHVNGNYYAIKDDRTDEVYKYVTNDGLEYTGPDITITENIYNNSKLGVKAQTYEVSVKVGSKVLNAQNIASDTTAYDSLKTKYLEKRKKYGESTYEDSRKSTEFEKVNKTSLDQSIYSGFSQNAVVKLENGNTCYDINKVADEIYEAINLTNNIIIGKNLYTVTSAQLKEYNQLESIDVPGFDGNVFNTVKVTLIQDSAFPIFVLNVTDDVDAKSVRLVIALTKNKKLELNLTLNKSELGDIDTIMESSSIDKLLELELDGDNGKYTLAENEYHVCSAVTLHHKLAIGGKDGSADVSTVIPVRSLEGKQFNNDGTIVIENVTLK